MVNNFIMHEDVIVCQPCLSSYVSAIQTHIRATRRTIGSTACDTMRYDFMTISLHACNANAQKQSEKKKKILRKM